jgi:hypothetical protein
MLMRMNDATNAGRLGGNDRAGGLLAWQLRNYAEAHGNRKNLVLHVVTVPLFWAGTVAVGAAAPLGSIWIAVAGVVAMVAAIAAQGRGHAREAVGPARFLGPLDAIVRIFAEQWVTFPRFIASGGFARAWKRASSN